MNVWCLKNERDDFGWKKDRNFWRSLTLYNCNFFAAYRKFIFGAWSTLAPYIPFIWKCKIGGIQLYISCDRELLMFHWISLSSLWWVADDTGDGQTYRVMDGMITIYLSYGFSKQWVKKKEDISHSHGSNKSGHSIRTFEIGTVLRKHSLFTSTDT